MLELKCAGHEQNHSSDSLRASYKGWNEGWLVVGGSVAERWRLKPEALG